MFNLDLTCSQPTPRCPTIQEQMDPAQPFNPMFVTQQFQSYVKASGDYVNGSVPIMSKVNLTCFFTGTPYQIQL